MRRFRRYAAASFRHEYYDPADIIPPHEPDIVVHFACHAYLSSTCDRCSPGRSDLVRSDILNYAHQFANDD